MPSPEPGNLDFAQGHITPEDAIKYFEENAEGLDVEVKVNNAIAAIEGAGQGEVFDKVQVARMLQGKVAEHLSKLEQADTEDLPADVLAKAKLLASRLHTAISQHSH